MKLEDEPVFSRDLIAEVGQDLEPQFFLTDIGFDVLGQLRCKAQQRRTEFLDFRENSLQSSLLCAAVRSPLAAVDADRNGASLEQLVQGYRFASRVWSDEPRCLVTDLA